MDSISVFFDVIYKFVTARHRTASESCCPVDITVTREAVLVVRSLSLSFELSHIHVLLTLAGWCKGPFFQEEQVLKNDVGNT